MLLGSIREQGMPGKRRSLGRGHPCRTWTEYVRRWSRESLGFPKCWARVCVPGEGMLAYVWSAWSAASCVGRIHLRAEQFLLRRFGRCNRCEFENGSGESRRAGSMPIVSWSWQRGLPSRAQQAGTSRGNADSWADKRANQLASPYAPRSICGVANPIMTILGNLQMRSRPPMEDFSVFGLRTP